MNSPFNSYCFIILGKISFKIESTIPERYEINYDPPQIVYDLSILGGA